MYIKHLFTLLLIAISAVSFGQNSTISGTVVDSKTLKPLSNVEVFIEGFEAVKSNSLGNFQIWNLPYGNYTLKANGTGYTTYTEKVNLDSDYKYLRVRMGEVNTVTEQTTSNTTTKAAPEVIYIRDTVYVEKIVTNTITVPSTETPKNTENILKTEKPVNEYVVPLDSPALFVPTIDLNELSVASDGGNIDNISSVLSASRDPFYNAAAFSLSSYRFRLRGMDNADGKLLMNNIEMNDLDIGRPAWTQWGGLNDVLRNRTNANGLEKSNFAFGGLLGASNIDLRASNQRKELKLSYAFSNRSYMQRAMATYSSGVMKGGWAVSFSGSWRFANNDEISEKIRFNQEGTTYEAYSIFGGVDKKFGKNHLLSLNLFASMNKRGKASSATQEMMDIAGSNYYNPNWGWQTEKDGKVYKRNAAVGTVFVPTAILMHDWTLKNNSSLKTSIAYRKGINGSTALDWKDATDPRPDYYRNMPSYALISNGLETSNNVREILTNNEDLRQINWDNLYEANYLSSVQVNNVNGTNDTANYNIAKYVLAERRYDPTVMNFSSIYEKIFSDAVTFNLGFNYANQKTRNFQVIKDLLGAEYFIDLNNFAERDFPGNATVAQNDLNRPNRLLSVGDRYGYDFTYNTRKAAVWGQTAIAFKKVDFFLANEVSFTNLWRTGHVKNGLFPDNSEGDSEIQKFTNYGIKGGLTYKINGRNYIFGNGSFGTAAPYIRNIMLSPRTRNDFVSNLKSETQYSGEIGYILKSPKIKVRLQAYAAVIENQTTNRSVYFDLERTFGTIALTEVNTRNFGVEAAASFEVFTGFTVTPVIAWGDHTYTSRPNATLVQDNNNTPLFEDKEVYFKGLHLANGPQAAYSVGLNYRTQNYWFFGVDFSYFDKIYIDPTPVRRIDEAVDYVPKDSELWVNILSQERMKGQFVMDASVGKSLRLKDKNDKYHYLNFNLNVGNLTNNTKFVTGGYESSRFDFTDKDLTKFQNEYFYAQGLNFYLGMSYRF